MNHRNETLFDENSMKEDSASARRWRVITVLIFVLVPLLNFGIPAFLESQDRFADDPETRVNAASYAFAIWGLIFSGLLLFSASLIFGSEPDSPHLNRALVCLSIAGVASILFVPISLYGDQFLSWLDILLHLIPLAIANFYLRSHARKHPSSAISRWTYFGPSMYLGWISAATVISTALMANQVGIDLGENLATGIATGTIVVLGIIGAALTLARDPVYGGTVVWALVAVGVEQSSYPLIRTTAWLIAGLVALVVLFQCCKPDRFFAIEPQRS